MDKLKMHSPNLVDENISKIAELFPNCITESKDGQGNIKIAMDFDLLKQELSETVVEGGQERYRLDWPGKRESILLANSPIAKTLRPNKEESVNFDTTENLFIEGDNLDALKLLQETYLGKVKMIYIDPPYNTGKDFLYKDNFSENTDEYLTRSNQKDEEGNQLVANTESNGRFHSDWLSMIYPRLKLARDLLSDDGVIFVSCDENEAHNIKLLMNEIFGESNFISDIIWAAGKKNDSRFISVSHEYILCYVRNYNFLIEKNIKWRQKKKGLHAIYKQYEKLVKLFNDDYSKITVEMKAWFKNLPDSDPAKLQKHYSHADKRGLFFPDNISWPGGGGPRYQVLHPVTSKPVKIPSRGWITNDKVKMQEWITKDLVCFGNDENSVPCIKSYLKDREYQTPYSVFYQDGRAASKRLRELLEANFFPFPKDENVIKELSEFITSKDDIILDFFAGSATTAHAVMQLNAEDGGNRKFIMVQLPEPCDEKSEAFKAGYPNIAEISKERIRRAGKKILEGECHENWNRDVGFRVLKIDSSNMEDVYYTPDKVDQSVMSFMQNNIKSDRTAEDLLFQVMLDWGVELSLPIEKKIIAGTDILFVDGNALAACFNDDGNVTEELVKEITKFQPLRVVFRDAGFKNDSIKNNVESMFKLLSPVTKVKSI